MGTRQQKNLKASAWPLNFASSAPWLAHHHLHIKIPLQNEKMTRSSQCILLCTKPLIEIWVFLAAYWKVPLWTHWSNMEKGGIFCSSKSLNGTRGHFSCLLLENILLMVLPPFFTPSCFLQKDGGGCEHCILAYCKNQVWQVLMENSLLTNGSWFQTICSTIPFIWSWKDGRAEIVIFFSCFSMTLSDETCRYFWALWHFTNDDELWTLTKRLYNFAL